MSRAAATASGQQWYRTLNATQWKTLLASNLGWVFDGFETFATIETMPLECAAKGYDKVMRGEARFRMVLTTGL